MREHLLNSRRSYQKLRGRTRRQITRRLSDCIQRISKENSMKKVLITGAAGDIGTRLRKC